MKLSLRPASDEGMGSCKRLSHGNMAPYLAARNIAWAPDRFRANWNAFENAMILADDRVAGLLRLQADDGALEIRDLQLQPVFQRRGIGSWAIRHAKSIAAERRLGGFAFASTKKIQRGTCTHGLAS